MRPYPGDLVRVPYGNSTAEQLVLIIRYKASKVIVRVWYDKNRRYGAEKAISPREFIGLAEATPIAIRAREAARGELVEGAFVFKEGA